MAAAAAGAIVVRSSYSGQQRRSTALTEQPEGLESTSNLVGP
jgi:hypothetical protein